MATNMTLDARYFARLITENVAGLVADRITLAEYTRRGRTIGAAITRAGLRAAVLTELERASHAERPVP